MTSAVLDSLRTVDPARPAIDDGTLRLSYGELHRLVDQEQRWLRAHGVHRCALIAENGAGWIISDLALLGCEALNVPVSGSFTTAQTRHVLFDAAIESVLTEGAEQFVAAHPEFVRVAQSDRTGLVLLQRSRPAGEILPAEVSKVTYTSGSTGAAKGVCLSTAAIETVTRSLVTAIAELGIERHMCLLPLPTLLENIAGVYAPLLLGAQICVQPSASIGMSYAGLNVSALPRAVAETAPHSLVLVPELLRVLVQASQSGWRAPASLKFIAVGGAAVSVQLLEQARDAGLPIFQGYGLSECASVVCLNTPAHNKPGSVGKPLPHARVRIDASGEICVSGATLTGYLGDVHRAPTEIRTGDLGEIDHEGFVYVRGRAKNMFITSMGRNVTPEWVERELTAEPAILQAIVAGEARPYPVALLVPAANVPSQALSPAMASANSRLPDYARVRRWTLIPEAPSPANGLMTANGRLRRAEIISKHGTLLDSLYVHEDCKAHAIS
jgi:long-chain acyl-CoA synthetase